MIETAKGFFCTEAFRRPACAPANEDKHQDCLLQENLSSCLDCNAKDRYIVHQKIIY